MASQILGANGEPYQNGTATERFARDFNIGPESGFAVPQIITFSSILGSTYRNYYHGQYDEAMRFNRDDALAMRNDAFVRSLVDERKLAVASLKWHIEVDNPRDAWQKAMRDGLTQIIKHIPRWTDLTWSGLEAIWYGRYGDQFDWTFKEIELPAMPSTSSGGGLPAVSVAASPDERVKKRVLWMRNHMPVEGDKIDYDFDGNPYVLINAMAAANLFDKNADVRVRLGNSWIPYIKAKHGDVGYTTIGGRALFLTGSWRSRYRIHTHEALDSSFFEPWKAGGFHGIGIRSVVFWYWWLRQEFLSNVTDWCARTGLGMKLWYYEQGNNASKLAVSQAAKDQNDKVNVLIPYDPTQQNRPGVEVIETSGTGADLLLKIVQHFEEYLERYIVGQRLSSGGSDSFKGFGDKGRAEFAESTKYQITKRDAAKFGDTNTSDVLAVIQRWSYPELADVPTRFVYEVDDPKVSEWMEGAKMFVDMGGKVVASEARQRLGLSAPREGDETIGGMEALQMKQATSGHVKPPDGMNPGTPEGSAPTLGQESTSSGISSAADTASRFQLSGAHRYYNVAKRVEEQLAEDYPPEALEWIKDAEWTGPDQVPLDDVDFSNMDSWRASREPEKVAKFQKKIRRGRMKPVILIKKPGKTKLIVADGHHRSIAYKRNKMPITAWVAKVPEGEGAWDHMHNAQKHGGHDPYAQWRLERAWRYANLDDQGGVVPEDPVAAKKVDLITLPTGVQGTNCFNCKWIERAQSYCSNPSVHQHVTERNCCALWDAPNTGRNYQQAELKFEEKPDERKIKERILAAAHVKERVFVPVPVRYKEPATSNDEIRQFLNEKREKYLEDKHVDG